MPALLDIRINMNSSVEDVLAFKTCCGLKANDQNFEVHVKNMGISPVVIPSRLELVGTFGSKLITYLMPNGDQSLEPGELKAFYCTMDEVEWSKTTEVVMFDLEGNRYAVPVNQGSGLGPEA